MNLFEKIMFSFVIILITTMISLCIAGGIMSISDSIECYNRTGFYSCSTPARTTHGLEIKAR